MAQIVPASSAMIDLAAEMLTNGQIIAFPTETVYGLGASALDDIAVARIYSAKKRPSHNPLIVHVLDLTHAAAFAQINSNASRLAAEFWPGPMTLILPIKTRSTISPLVTAGLSTVAVRVPSHPVAHALLEQVAIPVAAPSANTSGHISATTANHVAEDLEDVVKLVLDGGQSDIGLESTVIDLSINEDPRILRHGALDHQKLNAFLRIKQETGHIDVLRSPGQMASHYAPDATVRLNAKVCHEGEAFLNFGASDGGDNAHALNLSESGDLNEAAKNLFSMLRELDKSGASGIAVAPIPNHGIGIAINDRLRRASAPRSTFRKLAS